MVSPGKGKVRILNSCLLYKTFPFLISILSVLICEVLSVGADLMHGIPFPVASLFCGLSGHWCITDSSGLLACPKVELPNLPPFVFMQQPC